MRGRRFANGAAGFFLFCRPIVGKWRGAGHALERPSGRLRLFLIFAYGSGALFALIECARQRNHATLRTGDHQVPDQRYACSHGISSLRHSEAAMGRTMSIRLRPGGGSMAGAQASTPQGRRQAGNACRRGAFLRPCSRYASRPTSLPRTSPLWSLPTKGGALATVNIYRQYHLAPIAKVSRNGSMGLAAAIALSAGPRRFANGAAGLRSVRAGAWSGPVPVVGMGLGHRA